MRNPTRALPGRVIRKAYASDGLGDGMQGLVVNRLPCMKHVEKALKIHEVQPIINEHNIGSVAQRDGEWTFDIFDRSQRDGWDAD